MTYNLQRKIKLTITRYIKNIHTWEKNKNEKKNKKQKPIKSAKKILKIKNNDISEIFSYIFTL